MPKASLRVLREPRDVHTDQLLSSPKSSYFVLLPCRVWPAGTVCSAAPVLVGGALLGASTLTLPDKLSYLPGVAEDSRVAPHEITQISFLGSCRCSPPISW